MQRQPEDSILLSDCLAGMRGGDTDARERLLQHFAERFERLASHMLKGFPGVKRWEETADVMQASMMRLIKALESVEPESAQHFLSLAATQMRRELIDLARRHQGPQGFAAHHASWPEGEGSAPLIAAEGADETYDPGRLAEWCELHEHIASLPDDERRVCELLWYQGLTQREAAVVLDVSERTVKRRWQTVRLKLHEVLGGKLS